MAQSVLLEIAAVTNALQLPSIGGDHRVLQQHREEMQLVSIQQPYHPSRQVLGETMHMTLESWQIPSTEQDLEEFATALGRWQPFPDTQQALLELQKLTKTVLITNADNEIIAQSERTLGVTFDDIITAQQAGAYKPSHKGFLLARHRLGLPVSEIWHAGFGFKYDIVPATELGYTTVWVNRQGEARPMDVHETFLVGDLRTLLYLVKGMAAEM